MAKWNWRSSHGLIKSQKSFLLAQQKRDGSGPRLNAMSECLRQSLKVGEQREMWWNWYHDLLWTEENPEPNSISQSIRIQIDIWNGFGQKKNCTAAWNSSAVDFYVISRRYSKTRWSEMKTFTSSFFSSHHHRLSQPSSSQARWQAYTEVNSSTVSLN